METAEKTTELKYLANNPADIKQRTRILFEDLSRQINNYEQTEEYEVCAELLSYTKQISDYLLGYTDFEEIIEMVYTIVKSRGVIFNIAESQGVIIFDFLGHLWGFQIENDYEEIRHLINIHEFQIAQKLQNK